MNRFATYLASISLLLSAALCVTCSRPAQTAPSEKPASQSQSQAPAEAAPAVRPAQPAQAAQPAAAASTPSAPAGNKSTEKHTLNLTNYAGVAVTVTLNGAWVGQWDTHANAPLDSVVAGKNELVVELADEPKNQLQLEVNAQRGGQNVNLLRLNFQGKKAGKYTYNFVAK